MERTIKFRAWDKTDKFMMDDVYFRRVDLSKIPFKRSVEGPRWTVNLECEDIIIMQFTGLLDKNEREIYEGDICRFYEGLPKPWTAEVAFIGAGFCAVDRKCCEECAQFKGCIGPIDELGELEIIGNIYENPDLLK